MTDRPEVVDLVRAGLIRQLHFAGPEVTEQVLTQVSTVVYRGDYETYIDEAMRVAAAATEAAIRPRIERLQAESAAHQAQAARIQAEYEHFQREFEEFRRMETPRTIQ